MTLAEQDLLYLTPSTLFIGGRWRSAERGRTFDVTDPSTGLVLKAVADADPEDGLRALQSAADAQVGWAKTPPRVRSDILGRTFQLVQEHAEKLALLITLEMGKPLAESRAEVQYGAEFLRWFAEEAVRINGRYSALPEGTGTMIVTRRPVGPCFFITPWNFPLAMATRKIAPALAAGCTVVIKPAALTPLTTLFVSLLFEEAGLPAGVLNVVPTSQSSALSAPILADRRLRKLSFTGSTAVGQSLLRQAADNVLRTSMELGGNAPFIVFEDADFEAAIAGALAAKFRNVGQACTAANRFLVHASIVDGFAEELASRVRQMVVGRGTDPEVTVGPLIYSAAVDKAQLLVEEALSRGARLLTGGSRIDRPGTYFEPSVVSSVSVESRLYAEEIFGPVISIVPFETEHEAVRYANGTEYGLAAYVYTQNLQRAHRLIDQIDTGIMGINAGVISNAAAPFGGVKHSGTGREGGIEGIGEYLDTKYTFLPAEPQP